LRLQIGRKSPSHIDEAELAQANEFYFPFAIGATRALTARM